MEVNTIGIIAAVIAIVSSANGGLVSMIVSGAVSYYATVFINNLINGV